jgi:stress-induced morphogen
MLESLKQKLQTAFEPTYLDIVDNSHLHAGHAAMKNHAGEKGLQGQATHLAIIIVSEAFEGVSLLSRHQRIQHILKPHFETHLHALELKPYSPSEWLIKCS